MVLSRGFWCFVVGLGCAYARFARLHLRTLVCLCRFHTCIDVFVCFVIDLQHRTNKMMHWDTVVKLFVPGCCCVPMQVSHVAVLLGCFVGTYWCLVAAVCLIRFHMWLCCWGVLLVSIGARLLLYAYAGFTCGWDLLVYGCCCVPMQVLYLAVLLGCFVGTYWCLVAAVCLCRFHMWLCCWGALLGPIGAWSLLCAYAGFTCGRAVGVLCWDLLVLTAAIGLRKLVRNFRSTDKTGFSNGFTMDPQRFSNRFM